MWRNPQLNKLRGCQMGLANDLIRSLAEEFGAHAVIGRFPRFFGLQPGQSPARPDPQEPRRVPDALLKLDPKKLPERAQWLAKLPDPKKRALERFSAAALENLFAQDDPNVRDALLQGLLEKGFFEELVDLKQKIEAATPAFPKLSARLQRWGEWGKQCRTWKPEDVPQKFIDDSFWFVEACGGGTPEEQTIILGPGSREEKTQKLRQYHTDLHNRELRRWF